jgi:Bacteriophage replication protein O
MSSGSSYRFSGFDGPNYTPTPDALFDELLPELSESELKVLLYVIRRTFGFKKDADAISITQLAEGIKTRDGRVLDRGTGLSRTSVKKATASLVDKGVLVVRQVRSPDGDYESNVFSLRFRETERVGQNLTYPRTDSDLPVGQNLTLQETVRQETAEQEFENSNGRPSRFDADDRIREALLPFAEDFGRELSDQAPLTSTLSRLVNLYHRSGCDLNDYIDLVYRARRITHERSAAIRGTAETARGKAKMGYFFAILEDQLGVRAAGATVTPPE